MRTPEYHISIERFDTEQRVFHGVVRGPLVPLLEGVIMEHAKVTDAGKRLSDRQLRRAYGNRA